MCEKLVLEVVIMMVKEVQSGGGGATTKITMENRLWHTDLMVKEC